MLHRKVIPNFENADGLHSWFVDLLKKANEITRIYAAVFFGVKLQRSL